MHMHQSNQADTPQTLVEISFENAYESGKTVVHESIDPTPASAALSGAMWAGLFGLILGGPVGWIAGLALGALGGAVTAKVMDLGVPDEWITWFRDTVQPGTATVAHLVENLDRNALVTEAARFTGAELIYANLDDSTIEQVSGAFASHVPTK